ncbi:Alpha/beta hydrolase fold-1 [Lophiotrema nucula]|uniref:Alpha/beta hydrolase fold-1 n=1 Tax=Lophiotrema nucula TaxID=690887 RepID=A0A6A5YRM5_9PLEO|nr:Alpha/beta hydrolase fold-1 [Lophiotrema nucula]
MSNPVFVLIHGAWHTPHCWTKLIPELQKHGYEAVAPQMPSSATPPAKDWDQDIETIRSTVTKLAKDHGRDIIMALHSNAGMTGGTALEGLSKDECVKNGWKGGVVRLVYICGYIVPEGTQLASPGNRGMMDKDITIDFDTNLMTVAPDQVKSMMYQDLSDEEVAEVAKTLNPHSFGAVCKPTWYAAWKYIPTTYVITLRDKPSTVMAAEALVKGAMESEPTKVEKVIRAESGHSPFWSRPKWCAKMLIEEDRPKKAHADIMHE